jgi:hypothetical protein
MAWVGLAGLKLSNAAPILLAPLKEKKAALLKPRTKLPLVRQLALYGDHGLPVTDTDWELNIRVLEAVEERPGVSYWVSTKPLR